MKFRPTLEALDAREAPSAIPPLDPFGNPIDPELFGPTVTQVATAGVTAGVVGGYTTIVVNP